MPYTKTHKIKTRERILDSSFRLFAIKGFKGVSIDDLMKTVGLLEAGFMRISRVKQNFTVSH